MNTIKNIKDLAANKVFEFSICTIVNNMDEYNIMQQSFEAKGFLNNCEYIIADNTNTNNYNAYEAISLFLKRAQGRFLIIVHQDVRCLDERAVLEKCIANLEQKDSNWAICGNAGAKGYHEDVVYISYENGREIYTNLPQKVSSLDENFMVIKSSSNVTISADLKGFHLYGTDICIIANVLGYTCYIIPFMVEHLSKGNLKSLSAYKGSFIKSYGKKLNIGFVQTTCTSFFLSNKPWKNKLLNTPFFFFIMKQIERYPQLIKSRNDSGLRKKESW
jgi:hypothetical protein